MKTIKRKTTVLATSLLLLLLPLFAQKLPSSGLLLPALRNQAETLPSSKTLSPESSSLPQTTDRPVLTAFGDPSDEGVGDLTGLENKGASNDAPVTGGMYLLIVLVILYGVVARRGGTRMTQITRMYANLFCLSRKLKHTVNKVLPLRGLARTVPQGRHTVNRMLQLPDSSHQINNYNS
jgi:hypothetical protein